MLGGYFVATCAYSFNLKKRILVDVFMLAVLLLTHLDGKYVLMIQNLQ